MYSDPKSFLNPEFLYAVAYASNDKRKLGFDVYAAFANAPHSVVAINPRETSVQGDPCFPNLTQTMPVPDVVVLATLFYEDENAGIQILREMKNLGLFRAWGEMGCVTPEMEKFAQENAIDLLTGFSLRAELVKN